MQMTEDIIRNVVQEVLAQMGNGASLGNGKAPSRASGNLGCFPTADDAVSAADAAFRAFRTRPLEDRKKAVDCIRKICVDQAEELGRLELEETKIGRLDHKIGKLRDAIPRVPGVEYLRTDNDSGDGGLTLTDYAPFGVIGAITPVTHSLPTLAGNAINMLAAGNTVVFNAHPSGAKIAAEGVRRFNKAIREAIGIENLLTIIDPPTLESANDLFKHRGVRLLVVTGGPAVARAALASNKRAIVAGPGNPPVVVDATACLENAARSIVAGGAFDNNLLCIGEKQVFAVAEIFDALMEEMARHGGFRLNAGQVDALTQAAFQKGNDGALHVNKDLIGKDPAVLGQYAGVRGPRGHADPLRRDRRRAPVRPPRADDAVHPVRPGPERRPRHRPGQGERAGLRPHGHAPLARYLGHVEDGQDHGLHHLRRQRPLHGRARPGRRGRAVVLDRGPDRRGRHHAADLHPPAAHQPRRRHEVHLRCNSGASWARRPRR